MTELNIVGVSGQIGSGKDTVADRFVDKGYAKVSLADPMKRFANLVFGFTEEQLWGPSDCRNAVDDRYAPNSVEWIRSQMIAATLAPGFICDLMPDSTPEAHVEAMKALQTWYQDLYDNHPNLSPRVCLQTLGTEWGRAVSENVWVDYLYRTAEKLKGGTFLYGRTQGLIPTKDDEMIVYSGIVVPDVRFENELKFFSDQGLNAIRVVRPDTDGEATKTGVVGHKSETEQQGFDPALFSAIIQNEGTLEELLAEADKYAEQFQNEE